MSRDLVSKIAYNENEQTVVMTRCNTKGVQLAHDGTYTITVDMVKNAPEFCDTDYSKLMFGLFSYLTDYATLHRTAPAKFRTAYDIVYIASKEKDTDIASVESFKLFLEALDNGNKMITKGKFIVAITKRDQTYYHKNATAMTADKSQAMVFKTLEDAKITAINKYGVVEAI